MHVAAELRRAIESALPRLNAISESESAHRAAPGKWSKREILGHLVDSAANNHVRFVCARFQDDLVFPGYDQDDWVRVQRHDDAKWTDLIALWRSYNLHLARVMEATPQEDLVRQRTRHNLHEIAWRTVPASQPTTLEYFMRDYVGHLKHHLAQALDR